MKPLNDLSVGAMRFAFLFCLALLGSEGRAAWSQSIAVQTPRCVAQAKAGELLVKYGSSSATTLQSIRTNIREVRTVAAPVNLKIGATELKSFGAVGWQLVKLPADMSVEDGMKFYKSQPGVADVEPNSMRYLMALPDDPSYERQYGLEKIGAPAAWNKTKGSAGTIVAVIDSGVNYTHEDLAPNMWKNPKEVVNGKDDDGNGYIDDVYGIDAGDADSDPMDANHHGSHCAGIIGAAGNNGIGGSGVNWITSIMACKVMRADGGIPTSAIMEALQYVITMKARGNNIRVVNESLGGPTYNQAEHDLIQAVGDAGVLVAAAAGNETNDNDAKASYPASYDCTNIIAVAASDSDDQVADFSNWGATTVDLAAPGVDIYSTFWPGNQAYSNLSGTSMATPMVAGAAALLAAFSPSQTPVTLRKVLMDTVDPLPQWEGKVVSGGRMNLARALNSIDPNGSPTVNNVTPRAVANALKPAITVNFSKPMNPTSVQANFSLTPSVAGTFVWTNNNQIMTFTPNANLVPGSAYQARIKGDALSAANIKLDGDSSGTSTGSPSDDYVWQFRIAGAPSNDYFANAMPLSGDSGFVPSHNFGATREPGEPGHGNYFGNGDKSVWFKWTAPSDGNVVFTTQGTSMSHVIAAYSGSSVSNLSNLAQNDTFHGYVTIEFRATVGTTYSIAVDGMFFPATEKTPAFTDTGNIGLNWTFYRSPSNDYFNSAQLISGTTGTTSGNTLGSYSENNEPNHVGRDSSVWYKWTAPANGAVTFDTIGSKFDATLVSFSGSSLANIQEVAHDARVDSDGGCKLPFTVSGGTTYYVAVGSDGYAFYDARGDYKLNWQFVNAPVNDAFLKATPLSPATSGSVNNSTYGATIEANEPDVLYRDGRASIWYSWIAPANGMVTLDTQGSGFDTNLAIFTGSSISNLITIDQNDDDSSVEGRSTSKIKCTVVGGTKYWIRIDSPAYASSEASIGYPDTHGATTLTWAFTGAPSNDLFAGAQLLNGNNGRVIGTNIGASLESGEPTPQYRDYGESIWYKWKAPSNGAVTFDTGGSTLINGVPTDTYISVYTGSQIQGLSDVDYNDDNELDAPTQSSRVRFTVVSGTTYYIRIDGNSYTYSDSGKNYEATHGSVALQWDFVTAPSNDNFANAINLTPVNSGRTVGTTVGANLEAGEENPTYRNDGCSIWYKWTAPSSGPVTFSTDGSKNLFGNVYDTNLAIYSGDAVNALDWITQNGDDGALPTSKVTFDAESGVTYRIRVDNEVWNSYGSGTNFNNMHGQVILSWSFNNSPDSAPAITSFAPTAGQAGTAVTINGTNLDSVSLVKFDGITGSISSVSATKIVVTAPDNVHTGTISVASARGTTATATDFKVAPVITSFTPAGGAVGTQITITGKTFYGVTNVTIGGVTASFTVNSLTQITATVPAGAINGKVTVTTAGGTATSSTNFSLPPRFDSFSPTSGPVGTQVSIKGANFLGTTGVFFNGVKATNLQVVDTLIAVTVPANATTGAISVVTPIGTTTSTTDFVVTRPPTITGFTPTSGKTGTRVTISGTNFTGATAVRFNGVAATAPTIAANTIAVTVPAGASTGPISVTTPDGTATSAVSFKLDDTAPTVATTSPTQAQVLSTNTFTRILGSVSDNESVSSVQIKLCRVRNNVIQYWDGSAFGNTQVLLPATLAATNARSTTWAYLASPALKAVLDNSTFLVYTYATDAVGNVGTGETRSFYVDTVAPIPAITSPTQGQVISSTSFASISGTAADSAGISKVQIKLYRIRNGVKQYWYGNLFGNTETALTTTLASPGAVSTPWTYPVSAALKSVLDNGEYGIIATATDSVLNTGTSTERTFTVTVDTEKPAAAITVPAQSQSVNATSFTAISGNSTDNMGVSQVQVRLLRVRAGVSQYWNGTSFGTAVVGLPATLTTPNGKSTNWTYEISPALKAALDSGAYIAYATSLDAVGNKGEATARVFNIDIAKPLVAISSPTNNQTLVKSALTSITGAATDNVGVAQVQIKLARTRGGVKLFWNGTSFTNTEVAVTTSLSAPNTASTKWTYPVSSGLAAALDAGSYEVTMLGTDAAGNQNAVSSSAFTLTTSVTAGLSTNPEAPSTDSTTVPSSNSF